MLPLTDDVAARFETGADSSVGKRVLAQSGRGMVFDLAGAIAQRSSFTSLKQLQDHIDAYVNAYNDTAKPFVWTKKKVRQRRFKGRRITQL